MAKQPRAKQEPQDQPRSLTPQLRTEPELVRAGMYFTLQKLGDKERDQQARQLSFFGADSQQPEPEDGQKIEFIRFHLSASEDRAAHALQVLLDRTGYHGNLPSEKIYSEAWKWTGRLPRLAITYSDYFEAYGLKRMGYGSYYSHEAEIALEALASLQQPKTAYYTRKRWIGEGKARKPVYDVIKATRPLISITKGWQGLSQEEASRVLAGQENIPGRTTRLLIELNPLWVDEIENFYLLKPARLHAEIRDILGGGKHSGAVSLFIEWLLTLNRTPWRIGKELLAEKLHLDYLIRQRKRTEVDKRLKEAFETAKELGYLLAYREEPAGMMLFDLNSERCKRVQTGSEPGEEAE